MANAFISGRRYPTRGGGEIIPAGSQSFTGNGTFTAPYTGVYTVVLTAGHAASGSGGSAGTGTARTTYNSEFHLYYVGMAAGGGGGSGGGACICLSPGIMSCYLQADDSIQITCNSSIVSFGNLFSISSGTAGTNGGTGGNGTISAASGTAPILTCRGGTGGTAGIGGTPHTYNISQDERILFSISPIVQNVNAASGVAAGTGYTDKGANSINNRPDTVPGAVGARYNTDDVYMGGIGGSSGQVTYYSLSSTGSKTVQPSESAQAGIPAAAGRIDITWGNQ